jgi:hypothetical protein
MRRAGLIAGSVLAAFFIVRAIVELVTLDYADPSSYEHDWGGPTVVGVLLVHCFPGFVAAAAVVLVMRRSRRTAQER